HGFNVTIGCSSGALDEIWYHYDVLGSVQTGEFVPTVPDGTKSDCPATGVKYLPKIKSTATATASTRTSSTSASATLTGPPFSGRGFLNVIEESTGMKNGCIISRGTWYTTGTCATYTASANGKGFNLKSSRGWCQIRDDTTALFCDASVASVNATAFTAAGSQLKGVNGVNWFADVVPTGQVQANVFTDKTHPVKIRIDWQSI
ncbi:hypothetical protein LTS18_013577, partial [Coniosporium uncinatum]